MNPKPVVLRDKALHDFEQVIDHYRSGVSPLLARSFGVALQEAFRHLSLFPASGSTRYSRDLKVSGLRSWPVSGYPYLVFYAEQELSIDIYRVLHTARDLPKSLADDLED